MTVATLIMYLNTGVGFFGGLAALLLVALSLFILSLIVRTSLAVKQQQICVEGH